MTDREKLINLIMQRFDWQIAPETEYKIIINANLGELVDALIAHGVTVRKPQKPIEMSELPEDSVCWYEEKYEDELYPVYLEEGHVYVFVSFIGIEFAERHEKCNYGKTWRCWAEKPTGEERKAAEWERPI